MLRRFLSAILLNLVACVSPCQQATSDETTQLLDFERSIPTRAPSQTYSNDTPLWRRQLARLRYPGRSPAARRSLRSFSA